MYGPDPATRQRLAETLLTALAVIVGSAMILFDPFFQGLAISLATDEVASVLLSRMAVPVLYAMVWRAGSSEASEPLHVSEAA